jgi:hypothetical protein
MVTKLDRSLRRELTIKGRAYVVTLDDKGLKLTLKGRRNGQELLWDDFVTGEAALATALTASLAQANDDPPKPPPKSKKAKKTAARRAKGGRG